MRTAYLKQFFDDRRARLRRRGSGFLLALAVELLVIVMLLFLWPAQIPKFGVPNGDKTFQLFNANANKPATQSSQPRRATKTKPKVTPPREQIVPPTPPPILTNIPGLLTISRDDYQKSDIAKLPTKPADAADGSGDAEVADSGGEGDSEAIGRAPNGEPLYAAEWYREPTEQELSFYLPRNVPPGAAGYIACKTAPRHKVEQCVSLGDNAPGSGLARGVLNAAWQFQVRAPRKGGKDMMGVWVRIRIDIVGRGEK